ncbi:RICIN domain-containing protein [Streptomyces sp. NPDC048442]|uniref:RICIN domain-containing protein n=1 Tax=Streptomyces sp. NPDC048442 TaxID=3154823 RepID=UPI00341E92B8
MEFRVRKILTAAALCFALMGLTAGPASASGSGSISNQGYCLTPKGGSQANGTIITLWPCHSSTSQWVSANYKIVLKGSANKCITPYGGSLANGAVLTLWDCNNDARSQQFMEIAFIKYPAISVVNENSCITPKGNSVGSGVYATLWTCTGALSQAFSPDHWSID